MPLYYFLSEEKEPCIPLVVGIFIGRIGCFLSGTNEFTYGQETSSLPGMDLGDGLSRHPLALYELAHVTLRFHARIRHLEEFGRPEWHPEAHRLQPDVSHAR